MSWCEGQTGIDYVFGLATNVRLRRGATDVIEKAIAEYDQRLIPVVSFLEKQFHPDEDLSEEAQQLVKGSLRYRSLYYKTHDSWSRFRRVVTKVAYDDKGLKMRFVVTSLPVSKVPPGKQNSRKVLSQRGDGKPHQRAATGTERAIAPRLITLRATNCGCGSRLWLTA